VTATKAQELQRFSESMPDLEDNLKPDFLFEFLIHFSCP